MRNVARVAVLFALLAAAAVPNSFSASAEETSTYLVLYKKHDTPTTVSSDISRAGGTLVAAYDQIGVAVARSSSSSFASNLERDARIDGVASTARFGVKVDDVQTENHDGDGGQGNLPNAPAGDADTLSPLQWDMRQIHTPEAHAITGGSPEVIVGDIDTGLDFEHEDIAPNYIASKSADCSSGAPEPLAPDNDVNGHGTHTAGTIAAASNGTGIVGVAPNVKIAGIKSSNNDGFFFPEMVVCSFMWAGTQHLDVTNNSYFADPFLYNCRNDHEQHAIWKAEQRAIRFAMQEGVTVVASEGNDSTDHSHPTFDPVSPDFPPGTEEEREITNACVVVPLEIPGVIGVSAVGHNEQVDDEEGPDYLKSFYSSYGVSTVDVTAPGGDSIFGVNPEAHNGRVLSTYPDENVAFCRPDRLVVDATTGARYCYLQGTSMAAPHVSGVAALIISVYGDSKNPQNGKMRPGQVESFLQQTSDQQPCPSELPEGYEESHQLSGAPQECQGGSGHNSWYGAGQVNALRAVTHDSGQ